MKYYFIMLIAFLFVGIACEVSSGNNTVVNGIEDNTTIAFSNASGSSEVKTVVYVEINDNEDALFDIGEYYKISDKKPFFNIVNIFAANIKYDRNKEKPYISTNKKLTYVLENREKYIKPLQDKGIKVVLSILGHHGPMGISNLIDSWHYDNLMIDINTDKRKVLALAKSLKEIVTKYELDGIDFDDEWTHYTLQDIERHSEKVNPKNWEISIMNRYKIDSRSFGFLLYFLRWGMKTTYFKKYEMSNKIISYFFIGPSKSSFDNKTFYIPNIKENKKGAVLMPGQYLDYAYYPYYSKYEENFSVYGMKKSQLSAAAVRLSLNKPDNQLGAKKTTKKDAIEFARKTKRDGYGVYMMYDFEKMETKKKEQEMMEYLSAVSQELYGTGIQRHIDIQRYKLNKFIKKLRGKNPDELKRKKRSCVMQTSDDKTRMLLMRFNILQFVTSQYPITSTEDKKYLKKLKERLYTEESKFCNVPHSKIAEEILEKLKKGERV